MKAKSIPWSKHLDRQKQSGITIQSYCERYRLSPGMFYYWKRKLSTITLPDQLSFKELEVLPEQLAIPVFVVELKDKASIRIEGNVSPAFLRELIGC